MNIAKVAYLTQLCDHWTMDIIKTTDLVYFGFTNEISNYDNFGCIQHNSTDVRATNSEKQINISILLVRTTKNIY